MILTLPYTQQLLTPLKSCTSSPFPPCTERSTDPSADSKSRASGAAAAQEVRDVEGVHLEERRLETSRGEDSELSLSFQGYVAELRQCQSKMRNAQMPSGLNPPEVKDCTPDLYKATVV